MKSHSLATSIVLFSGAVLVAAWALNRAAGLLIQALPVLLPAVLVVLIAYIGLRLWRQSDRW